MKYDGRNDGRSGCQAQGRYIEFLCVGCNQVALNALVCSIALSEMKLTNNHCDLLVAEKDHVKAPVPPQRHFP
jgi:hypothetical protein